MRRTRVYVFVSEHIQYVFACEAESFRAHLLYTNVSLIKQFIDKRAQCSFFCIQSITYFIETSIAWMLLLFPLFLLQHSMCQCLFVLLWSRLLSRSNSISMYRTHTHVKITFHEQTVWNLWLENIFTKTSSSILYCVRASASVSFLIHAFYFGGWVFSVQRQRWRRHTFNQLCKCKCMNEEWMRFS